MKKIIVVLLVVLSMALLSACEEITAEPPKAKDTQAQKAEAAANSISFTENAEIDNIKKRLELTANPGLLGFVVLLNETGQPVMNVAVKGKITSGNKRLTDPQTINKVRLTPNDAAVVTLAPSDEGTYGSSGEYIFFWAISGQYIQWNGKYLYSDKPFRLNIEPIVVSAEQ